MHRILTLSFLRFLHFFAFPSQHLSSYRLLLHFLLSLLNLLAYLSTFFIPPPHKNSRVSSCLFLRPHTWHVVISNDGYFFSLRSVGHRFSFYQLFCSKKAALRKDSPPLPIAFSDWSYNELLHVLDGGSRITNTESDVQLSSLVSVWSFATATQERK